MVYFNENPIIKKSTTMFSKGIYNGDLQEAIESFNFTAITSKNTGGFINMIVYEKSQKNIY